jgi:hypothetical protein
MRVSICSLLCMESKLAWDGDVMAGNGEFHISVCR